MAKKAAGAAPAAPAEAEGVETHRWHPRKLRALAAPALKKALTAPTRKGGALAAPITKALAAVAVNAEATIWTPAAGRRFRWVSAVIAGSVAGNYTFKDNTAGTVIAIVPMLANTPIFFEFAPKDTQGDEGGIASAAINNVLTCTGPAASTLSGTLYGDEEP